MRTTSRPCRYNKDLNGSGGTRLKHSDPEVTQGSNPPLGCLFLLGPELRAHMLSEKHLRQKLVLEINHNCGIQKDLQEHSARDLHASDSQGLWCDIGTAPALLLGGSLLCLQWCIVECVGVRRSLDLCIITSQLQSRRETSGN